MQNNPLLSWIDTRIVGPVLIHSFRTQDADFFEVVFDAFTGKYMFSQLFDDCGEPIGNDSDDKDELYSLLEKEAMSIIPSIR